MIDEGPRASTRPGLDLAPPSPLGADPPATISNVVPQPDTQSLPRLLVTLGVFLCFTSIVGPLLILRDTRILEIRAAELGHLTPVAKSEIAKRQRLATSASHVAPYAGSLSFAIGLGLLVWGALGVKKQDERRTEYDNVQTDLLRASLRDQTPEERQEELKNSIDAAETNTPPTEVPADRSGPPDVIAREISLRIGTAERAVLARLPDLALDRFEIREHVALDASGAPLRLDALLIARDSGQHDIAVEIKFTRNLKKTQHELLRRAAGTAPLYRAATGREAWTWLIVVTDNDTEFDAAHEIALKTRAAKGGVALTTVRFDDIDKLRMPRSLLG